LSTLVEGMLVGSVGFGESIQAGPANYSAEDAMARSIVRLECEAEELKASLAMGEAERDLLRAQVRTGEGLFTALLKTIGHLREEKAELLVKVVNLQGRSRPATLEEISESVREKYDPEYEFGGRDHE